MINHFLQYSASTVFRLSLPVLISQTEVLKVFSHLKLASHSYAGKRKVTCSPGFISLTNYIPVCSFLLLYKYTVMILCTLHACLVQEYLYHTKKKLHSCAGNLPMLGGI